MGVTMRPEVTGSHSGEALGNVIDCGRLGDWIEGGPGNQLISSAYVTHRAVSGTIRPKVTGSIRK